MIHPPLTHKGRVDWQKFAAGLKPGQTVTLPFKYRNGPGLLRRLGIDCSSRTSPGKVQITIKARIPATTEKRHFDVIIRSAEARDHNIAARIKEAREKAAEASLQARGAITEAVRSHYLGIAAAWTMTADRLESQPQTTP